MPRICQAQLITGFQTHTISFRLILQLFYPESDGEVFENER